MANWRAVPIWRSERIKPRWHSWHKIYRFLFFIRTSGLYCSMVYWFDGQQWRKKHFLKKLGMHTYIYMYGTTGRWALHQRQHSTRCCIAGGQVLRSQLYSVSTIWKYWLHAPGYALRDEFRSVAVFYAELDLIMCHKLLDCRLLHAELLATKKRGGTLE